MEGLKLGSDIGFAGSQCSECGMLHPPLPQGQRCPNAKVVVEGVKDEDVRKFVNDLNTIMLYHIQTKKISNTKKLFGEITLLVAKHMESYLS